MSLNAAPFPISGAIINVLLLLIFTHILGSSIRWMFKHRRNGWAYAFLPALASFYAIIFQATSLFNKFFPLGLDPILLNYWAQSASALIASSYAIALRYHLRCLKTCGMV